MERIFRGRFNLAFCLSIFIFMLSIGNAATNYEELIAQIPREQKSKLFQMTAELEESLIALDKDMASKHAYEHGMAMAHTLYGSLVEKTTELHKLLKMHEDLQSLRLLFIETILNIDEYAWRDDLLQDQKKKSIRKMAIEFVVSLIEEGEWDEKGLEELNHFVGQVSELQPRQKGKINKAIENLEITPSKLRFSLNDTIEAASLKQILINYKVSQNNLLSFLDTVQNNIYESVGAKLAENPDYIKSYFPRDDIVDKLLSALSRRERGHILLTGKVGVGKKTSLEMLQVELLRGKGSFGNRPPVLIEVPSTEIMTADPTKIIKRIEEAHELGQRLNRHVIVVISNGHIASKEVKESLKAYLARPLGDDLMAHVVWSTTLEDARKLKDNVTLMKNFVEVHVPELDDAQTIKLVSEYKLPIWRDYYHKSGQGLKDIDEEALEFALKYFQYEGVVGAKPSGPMDFLQGAIVYKMRNLEKQFGATTDFTLSVDDLRTYLKDKTGLRIVPGSPTFEEEFNKVWTEFDKRFKGNSAYKQQLKNHYRQFFSSYHHEQMAASIVFGPPGGGKTYSSDLEAEIFFQNEPLKLNGAEYKESINKSKLLGSPPGYVGSEEQRSVLTKFIANNPQGGIIVVEEADYLHIDVLQLFTNMITDKKFMDGLGQEWDLSKFHIKLQTNVGQDLMIPVNSENKMNWEQYYTRYKSLTEVRDVSGKEFRFLQKDRLDQLVEKLVGKIVTSSNTGVDTSEISQEAQKQRRRYKTFYIFPPDQNDLQESAHMHLERFVEKLRIEYDLSVKVSETLINEVLDVENFEFEKGHSYVLEKLDDQVFSYLRKYTSFAGQSISVSLKEIEEEGGLRKYLVIETPNGKDEFFLGMVHAQNDNQWLKNPTLLERIKKFSYLMSENFKGHEKLIQDTKELLSLKSHDWNTRVVMTLLGTSGNGKTEFFKNLAQVLFDSEKAFFKIPRIKNVDDLDKYFRPNAKYSGGNKQTEFEAWFLSRLDSGGGVILLDELLSLDGIDAVSVQRQVAVLNELYDMLDEGIITIGGKKYDARGFIIGITGNIFQKLFTGIDDSPEAEKLIAYILSKINSNVINQTFASYGIDAPKVARLRNIHILGPLGKNIVEQIGENQINRTAKQVAKTLGKDVEIVIDPKINHEVTTLLTTVKNGMRDVETKGINPIVKVPLSNILGEFSYAEKIEAVLDDNGKILWFVNGEQVIKQGVKVPGTEILDMSWIIASDASVDSIDVTPGLKDLDIPKKLQLSKETFNVTLHHEVYGHWMVGTMLSGKNATQTISLIPTDEALGYVRGKFTEEFSQPTLKSLIMTNVYLEAGHRAPFQEGIFATGGGSLSRPKDGPFSDDLGKVEVNTRSMFANNLLENFSDFDSSDEQINEAKRIIKSLGKTIADDFIIIGKESGEFTAVFEFVRDNQYIDKDKLDEFAKSINFEKLGGAPHELYLESLGKAIIKLDRSENLSDQMRKMLLEIFNKNFEEIQNYHGPLNSKFEKLSKSVVKQVTKVGCFKKMFSLLKSFRN